MNSAANYDFVLKKRGFPRAGRTKHVASSTLPRMKQKGLKIAKGIFWIPNQQLDIATLSSGVWVCLQSFPEWSPNRLQLWSEHWSLIRSAVLWPTPPGCHWLTTAVVIRPVTWHVHQCFSSLLPRWCSGSSSVSCFNSVTVIVDQSFDFLATTDGGGGVCVWIWAVHK